jgi:thiol:disulfide interchange protein
VATIASGRAAIIEIDVTTVGAYHVYPPGGSEFGLPLEVSVEKPFTLKGVQFPDYDVIPVDVGKDKPINEGVYHGTATLKLHVVAGDLDTNAKSVTLRGKVRVQACDDKGCKLPEFMPFSANLAITADGGVAVASLAAIKPPKPVGGETAHPAGTPTASPSATASASATSSPTASLDPAEPATERSFMSLTILCIGFGLLTLLMPCTYPMIPVTITVFTKGEKSNTRAAVMRASAYGAGIVVAYTGLGFLFDVIFGAAGQAWIQDFANNPWLNLAIAALFIYFAGSFFGFYELRLPGFVQSAASSGASKVSGGVTYPGLFMLGLLFMVTSYACGAPLVLGALAAGASSSRVPKPPGSTTYAEAYLTNITLREKKCRKVRLMS